MAQSIFLTGASGHTGNHCLVKALRDGYRVIASVRSEEKAELIRKNVNGDLSFAVIPDMTTPGVFDNYIASVDFVVHVASPVVVQSTSDLHHDWVEPAVEGTRNILEAAKKSPTVKKVVICSSLSGIVRRPKCFGDDVDGQTYSAKDRIPDSYYPRDGEHYWEGKAKALNLTDTYVQHGLHFDVINICPGTILGRSNLATDAAGVLSQANSRALAIALGNKLKQVPPYSVHVEDMARLHIDILKLETGKYHNFGAAVHHSWKDSVDIIRKHFPKAIEKGVFSMDGEFPDRPFNFDVSGTEEFFGMKFKSFEEQVVAVAEQYLELLDQ